MQLLSSIESRIGTLRSFLPMFEFKSQIKIGPIIIRERYDGFLRTFRMKTLT